MEPRTEAKEWEEELSTEERPRPREQVTTNKDEESSLDRSQGPTTKRRENGFTTKKEREKERVSCSWSTNNREQNNNQPQQYNLLTSFSAIGTT